MSAHYTPYTGKNPADIIPDGYSHLFLYVAGGSAGRGEVHTWCTEQFGKRATVSNPEGRWGFVYTGIVFREERDAFAFKLRWC